MLKDDGVFYLQIAGLRRTWQYEDLTWGLFMGTPSGRAGRLVRALLKGRCARVQASTFFPERMPRAHCRSP